MAIAASNVVMTTTSIPVAVHPNMALRRATYIRVSDLTSAYDVDHNLLEQELARVQAASTNSNSFDGQSVASKVSSDDTTATATATIATTTTTTDHTTPPTNDSVSADTQSKRLQPPARGYNICLRVGKVSVVVDKERVDRSRIRLAEVEVGDETGVVALRARDEQIDLLMELSSSSGAVVLRNCSIELYKGKHLRIAITKWGKLSPYPDNVISTPPPPSMINYNRNYSFADLSLVASRKMDMGSPNHRPNKVHNVVPDGMYGRLNDPRIPGANSGYSGNQHKQHRQVPSRKVHGSGDNSKRQQQQQQQQRGRQQTGGSSIARSSVSLPYIGKPASAPQQQQQAPYQILHGYTPAMDHHSSRYPSYPTAYNHSAHPHPAAATHAHRNHHNMYMTSPAQQQMFMQQQYEMQMNYHQQMYHDQQQQQQQHQHHQQQQSGDQHRMDGPPNHT